MALSNAVDTNAISRTLGYALDYRDTQTAAAGVLPVRIAVLSPTSKTTEVSKIENATKEKVLSQFGNCPAVEIVDIISKNTKAPIDVIAVEIDGSLERAFAKIMFSGTAQTKGTARIVVDGRYSYGIKIAKEQTGAAVADAFLNVLPKSTDEGKPIWTQTNQTGEITLFSSYLGKIGNDTKIQVEITAQGIQTLIDGDLIESVFNLSDGAGEPIFTDGFLQEQFGDVWYNIVVNPFSADTKVYTALKEFNGTPSDLGGTGRWNALKVKPFIAISGTNESDVDKLLSLKGSADDLTNVLATAPNSANTPAQIAAAYVALYAETARSKPYLDIAGKKVPVLSLCSGANIGEMGTYETRDNLAKNGITTCTYDISYQGYVAQDFITFRRPPEQSDMAKDWRYVRDLFIDFNIAYNYQVLQAKTLMNKVIVADKEIIQADRRSDVIRLNVWKSAVLNFFTQMIGFAYITDFEYSKENLFVELSGTNPKRINTQFAYKRTSTVSIASTTAYAGFSFGLEG